MSTTTETPSEKARRKGPPTFDHLKRKRPRTRTVDIILDDELAQEVADLAREVRIDRDYLGQLEGRGATDPVRKLELDEKQQRLADLQRQLREETATMRFEGIGRERFEEIQDEHQPTDEQKAEAAAKDDPPPEWNPDTFPQAVVQASCVEPKMTEEQVAHLWKTWNEGELTAIWLTAYAVNTQRRVVDLGEG